MTAVGVEQVNEWLQNIQVESWGDEFPVGPPLLSSTDEKAITEPGLEESILWGFVDVYVTA